LKKKTHKPETPSISCEVIKVFKSDPMDGYNRYDMRVAKWSCGKARVLEKRHVWNTKDGSLRNRKLIGLSLEDVKFILEHQQEIMEALMGQGSIQ
jgi:hypothetical protein